jgi:hypothetical protein
MGRNIRRMARRMFYSSLFTLHSSLLISCGSGQGELSSEEQALAIARQSYEALYSGNTDAFLDARAGADELDADYRQMLSYAYRKHAQQVNTCHHGVDSIVGTRAVMDSTLNIMQAFLTLYFADSTNEEIVVPMVLQGDTWMLK